LSQIYIHFRTLTFFWYPHPHALERFLHSRPPFAEPKKKVSSSSSSSAAEALVGQKRGAKVLVHVRGTYGNYSWGDVCSLGQELEDKKIKLPYLKPGHPKHDPKTMNVPYGMR
jgi:hypothetical protein